MKFDAELEGVTYEVVLYCEVKNAEFDEMWSSVQHKKNQRAVLSRCFFKDVYALQGNGKVSNAKMEQLALSEYAKFHTRRLKSPEQGGGIYPPQVFEF